VIVYLYTKFIVYFAIRFILLLFLYCFYITSFDKPRHSYSYKFTIYTLSILLHVLYYERRRRKVQTPRNLLQFCLDFHSSYFHYGHIRSSVAKTFKTWKTNTQAV